MLKKVFIAAAALFVGFGIIRCTKVGKEVGGLVELWCHKSGDWAKNQITPETRIEQLEMEIGKINKEIRVAKNKKADLKVDYQMLKDSIDELQAKQTQLEKDRLVLADLLEKSSTEVVFKGRTSSPTLAQQELEGLISACDAGDQTLKEKQDLLKARAQRLELAQRHILLIEQKKAELTNLVEQMKTQLARIRMKQTENNTTDFTDSQVNKCMELKQELKRMLLKEEALAEDSKAEADSNGTTTTSSRSLAETIKAARAKKAAGDAKTTAGAQ